MASPEKPDSASPSRYDVAIVGGGPAGLSAALWLARYLHSVVMIDAGDPRNWETRGIHGFLGFHGIRPRELRGRGRGQAERHGARLVDGTVERVSALGDEHFRLELGGNPLVGPGPVIESRRLLLAIGIRDVWPKIPGLEQCYGETVHVCPDCDGYETRDRKTVVVGVGRKAIGMALALTTWTDQIVICTNGARPDVRQSHMEKLQALNIPILTQRVVCARSADRELRCLDLEDGMVLDCERLYFAIGQYPADDIGVQLGCERDELGLVVVDETHHTSVRNVFAAGDIAPGPQLAISAAADGAVAALAIHQSLLPEIRRLD